MAPTFDDSPGLPPEEPITTTRSSFSYKFRFSERLFCYFSFFIFGVSICVAWNAILGLIPLFIAKDGESSQSVMLAAYNLPWLPLLLIQTRFDDSVDRSIGKRQGYSLRVCAGMIVLAASAFVCAWDRVNGNLYAMGGLAFAVGIAASLLNTTFYQLMPLYPKHCYAFLPMGNGAATVLMFGITWVLGLFSDSVDEVDPWRLWVYFGFVSAIQLLSLGVFLMLITSSVARRVMDTPRVFAGKAATNEELEKLLNSERPEELPRKEFLMRLAMSCISIFLNMSTTIMPLTFYQFMPTNNRVPCLSQVLNYVFLLGDFLGRMVVLLLRGRVFNSNGRVLAASIFRALSMAFFFVYTFTEMMVPDDWVAVGYLLAYFTLGGLCNTLTWTHGISSVPASQATKASSVINIALEVGVFVAIPWSFFIPASA